MNVKDILGYAPLIITEGGHGSNTSGKRTPKFNNGSYIQEYEFNKPTAQLFLDKAKEIGFEVLNVASETWDVGLSTRVRRANGAYIKHVRKYPNVSKEKLVIYVSFHYNAQDNSWGGTRGGIEVYYYKGAEDSKSLSEKILNNLIKGTSQINRGVKTADFYVLRKTSMTAVLIEAGFMDNLEEAKMMKDKKYQNEVAEETLTGCCEYIGIEYGNNKTEKEEVEIKSNELVELANKVEQYEKAIGEIQDIINSLK